MLVTFHRAPRGVHHEGDGVRVVVRFIILETSMRLGVLLLVAVAFPTPAELRPQPANPNPEQKRAVAGIEKAGGKVAIDAEEPANPSTKVVLGGSSTDS